ncbi:MAG: DNA-binding protein WhiA [Synergistaceae bacterium]|nr:DNA-binding protein WhiA [Synergistaceae bacterium]
MYDFASLLSIPRSMKGRVFLHMPPRLFEDLHERTGTTLSLSWLKGLWGACGSLYLPKTGYYLSFRVRDASIEERAVRALKTKSIKAGRRRFQGAFEIMLRDQQNIVDMLAGFNMMKTTLFLEERAIFRSLRNQANKLVNCDASNIRKSLEASSNQIEISKCALEHPEYEFFPAVWKDLVSSRLSNPSATLGELGRMQSPPVSKSTVKYRWKKMAEHVGASPYGGRDRARPGARGHGKRVFSKS